MPEPLGQLLLERGDALLCRGDALGLVVAGRCGRCRPGDCAVEWGGGSSSRRMASLP